MIKINVSRSKDRVDGYVGSCNVVSVSILMGSWHTATSCCLPSDFELAKEYVECMNQVYTKADEITKEHHHQTISMDDLEIEFLNSGC